MPSLLLAVLLLASPPDPSLGVLDRELFRVPFPGLRAVHAWMPEGDEGWFRPSFEVTSYYRIDAEAGWRVHEWAELYTLELEGGLRRGRVAIDAALPVHRIDRSYVRSNSLIHDGPDEYVLALLSPTGTVFHAPERGETGFGDLAVGTTVALTPAGGPSRLMLRAVLELPTGSEGSGFGNGGPDAALGIRQEWRGARWSGSLAAGYVLVGGGRVFGGLRPRDHAVAEASAALRAFGRWSAALGVSWCDSPYAEPGLGPVSDDGMILGTAVRYDTRDGHRLEWWLVEDPFPGGGQPDFSSGIGFRLRFR
jgi:hypothetical protein